MRSLFEVDLCLRKKAMKDVKVEEEEKEDGARTLRFMTAESGVARS